GSSFTFDLSLLFSPQSVLFQLAVTVSPTLYAPSLHDALPILMRGSVTVGALSSTVALEVSAVVVALPALSVAVTDTLRLAESIVEGTMVCVTVQVLLLSLAVSAEPPPNALKFTVTAEIMSALS